VRRHPGQGLKAVQTAVFSSHGLNQTVMTCCDGGFNSKKEEEKEGKDNITDTIESGLRKCRRDCADIQIIISNLLTTIFMRQSSGIWPKWGLRPMALRLIVADDYSENGNSQPG
jgi:hypothetical protein